MPWIRLHFICLVTVKKEEHERMSHELSISKQHQDQFLVQNYLILTKKMFRILFVRVGLKGMKR